MAFGVAILTIDYVTCGRGQAVCPWEQFADKLGYVYAAAIQYVGRALGARMYGYVPYYPNRAIQVFLIGLGVTLPWVIFFLLGVLFNVAVSLFRNRIRPQDNRPSGN
jgi:hypothetical protein